MTQQSFPLGRMLATPGALVALEKLGLSPITLLSRHQACDWSDMDKEDQESNREAIKNGSRVFSSYRYADDVRIWVITESDRLTTTVLLPSEY